MRWWKWWSGVVLWGFCSPFVVTCPLKTKGITPEVKGNQELFSTSLIKIQEKTSGKKNPGLPIPESSGQYSQRLKGGREWWSRDSFCRDDDHQDHLEHHHKKYWVWFPFPSFGRYYLLWNRERERERQKEQRMWFVFRSDCHVSFLVLRSAWMFWKNYIIVLISLWFSQQTQVYSLRKHQLDLKKRETDASPDNSINQWRTHLPCSTIKMEQKQYK